MEEFLDEHNASIAAGIFGALLQARTVKSSQRLYAPVDAAFESCSQRHRIDF